MTVKAPEEGNIWEWRVFGDVSPELMSTLQSLPVRNGLVDHPDEDIYLISPVSDQNVKLRKIEGRWVLKFKELLEKAADSIELYYESQARIFDLPVTGEVLTSAATLLGAVLPSFPSHSGYDRDQIIRIFGGASPRVSVIDVPKIRTQFMVDGGWVELAGVRFSRRTIQTVSIHSSDKKVVERTLQSFGPDAHLEVLNYIDACRRWG
ncbi:MAG TPA: hypothetical protein VI756_11265 [Blastocatellia bacterium]